MQSPRILISAFLAHVFLCSFCFANEDKTQSLQFEGGVVLDVRTPKNSSTGLLKASDRVPDANLDGIVTITTENYEIGVTVFARPPAWTDEILLNFMKAEYGAPVAPVDDLQIRQSPNSIEMFPDVRIQGFYHSLRIKNSYAQGELLVHVGGFVLGNLWIDLMFSTPADNPAPIPRFHEFPLRFSISKELDEDFLGPDELSIVRLQARAVR